MEYISFEHNNIAAELVKQAYDTPPLAFVHSYGCQQNVNDGERGMKGESRLMHICRVMTAPMKTEMIAVRPIESMPSDSIS